MAVSFHFIGYISYLKRGTSGICRRLRLNCASRTSAHKKERNGGKKQVLSQQARQQVTSFFLCLMLCGESYPHHVQTSNVCSNNKIVLTNDATLYVHYWVIYGKNYFAANRTQSRAGKYKVKLHLAETEMCLNFVAFVIPSNKTS